MLVDMSQAVFQVKISKVDRYINATIFINANNLFSSIQRPDRLPAPLKDVVARLQVYHGCATPWAVFTVHG